MNAIYNKDQAKQYAHFQQILTLKQRRTDGKTHKTKDVIKTYLSVALEDLLKMCLFFCLVLIKQRSF